MNKKHALFAKILLFRSISLKINFNAINVATVIRYLPSKRNSPSDIWFDYTIGKQTHQQLANKYLNLISDTTFFHRDFGVMVFIDSHSTKVIYQQIVKTEKDIYYKKAINRLREKGYFPI